MTCRVPHLLILAALVALLGACNPVVEETAVEPFAETALILEEPTAFDDPASPEPSSRKATSSSAVNPRRGVVTAGDIDDTLNLAAFQRYQSRMANRLKMPRLNLADAVRLQIVDGSGQAAPGAQVTLRRPGAHDPFYAGQAGVDGRLTVFPRALGLGRMRAVEVNAFGANQSKVTRRLTTGAKLHRVTLGLADDYAPEFLDLVFVFDTTGSMGDELGWLQKEFAQLARVAQAAAPQANMRFGMVAYRDRGDAYVTRRFGFYERPARMAREMRRLDANGGGDYPEAAAEAIEAALAMTWRRGQGKRLIVHVADAPPHRDKAKRFLDAARNAAKRNVQIYGLGASGVADDSEYLMRQAALITGGRYLFLTDDSGVGRAHAEPKVACYRVTRLKSLLTRVLQSELTGRRVEASDAEVLRSVGVYRNGECRG